MAPSFRKERSDMSDNDTGIISNDAGPNVPKGGMFERRRRRFKKDSRVDNHDMIREDSPGADIPNLSSEERRQQRRLLRKQKKEANKIVEDELDPYDSDPGESYREHCDKHQGFSTKTCLAVPKFLRNTREIDSVLTAPPSPMASEMGENPFGQVPSSLPGSLTRVRYSLRSSITDGSEKQPVGPTVMERRELRPNNVRLNVSHWSDEGGRPYMEDRYVTSAGCLRLSLGNLIFPVYFVMLIHFIL
jgi:hypothetical protein